MYNKRDPSFFRVYAHNFRWLQKVRWDFTRILRSHQWTWLRRLSWGRRAAAYGWGGAERARTRFGGFLGGTPLFLKTMWNTHWMLFGREAKGEVGAEAPDPQLFFFFFCRNLSGDSHFSVSTSILRIQHAPFTYSNQTSISFEMPPKNSSLSIKK